MEAQKSPPVTTNQEQAPDLMEKNLVIMVMPDFGMSLYRYSVFNRDSTVSQTLIEDGVHRQTLLSQQIFGSI